MWLRLVMAVLFLTFGRSAICAAQQEAGFQRLTIADGIEVGIWYPTSGPPVRQRLGLYAHDVVANGSLPAGAHPLVVMSHGAGGDFTGHADTAVALARSGFIVAALTHPGDNWRDRSRATQVDARPPAVSALISYMLTEWPGHAAIDANRIGAFGFSSGGFTVLAAAGGRPDLTRVAGHCAEHPQFFDCALLASQRPMEARTWPEMRDPRIKALVVAAPALGFTFDRAGLADLRIPVQLWRADEDRILPAPLYADTVRAALPEPPEFHAVANAGHFDFLAPCADSSIAPQLCQSASGFDRAAFHAHFNAEVVRFLKARL